MLKVGQRAADPEQAENRAYKELLGQALPLIARHAPGFEAADFALWFAFARGDPDIKADLEPVVASGRRLDPAASAALYDRYLISPRERALAAAQSDLFALIDRLGALTEEAVSGGARFGAELDKWVEALDPEDRARFGQGLESLLEGAGGLREALTRSSEGLRAGRETAEAIAQSIRAHRMATPAPIPSVDDAAPAIDARGPFELALRRACEAAAEGGGGSRPSLIMVGIDALEQHAARHGAALQNAMIVAVGQAVSASLRRNDAAGHFGDGRVVAILNGATLEAAEHVAERVRLRVASLEVAVDEQPVVAHPRVSVGLARLRKGEMAESIIGRLHRAMQRARMRGGDQVVLDG